MNCDQNSLSTDPVVIEKENVLRLLQHLKRDKFSGPEDIHRRIVKALSNVTVETLAMLNYIFVAIRTGKRLERRHNQSSV